MFLREKMKRYFKSIRNIKLKGMIKGIFIFYKKKTFLGVFIKVLLVAKPNKIQLCFFCMSTLVCLVKVLG